MKILVIEDDHKIASSIKTGFEQENWVCDLAFDGEDGFDLATTGDYDIIVLDLMLPLKDGLSVAHDLRSNRIHTPILMLTAKGELRDKIVGFESGADDYLVKPFAFEELIARVKALSRRPAEVKEQVFVHNDITLNTATQIVTKSKGEVSLSKKEFQLLEYLMRNKDKVISKDEIISRVWDYDSDILPNTVEVFIKFLRDKLGKSIVKTVRGFGYKLN